MDFVAPLTERSFQLARTQKVVKADSYQLYIDAQELLRRAEEQARQIIAEAERQREAEKQRGFEEGMAEAKLEAAERMIETVAGTVDYLNNVEQTLVNLVLQAIEKVLGELDDRALITRIVQNALSVVRSQKQVALRVAPDQVSAIKEQLNGILKGYPTIAVVDVIADARLGRGGCILESDIGMVDASIEVQLAAMRRAIARSFGQRSGPGNAAAEAAPEPAPPLGH